MISKVSIVQLFFIISGVLVLNACTKNNFENNVQSAEYFPNSVGDYWEYDVFDSSDVLQQGNSRNYTVEVSIVGTKKLLDDQDATIWQYHYPWGNDTNYVRVVGDTIKIFDLIYSRYLDDLNYPRQTFLLPFEDGKSWNGKLLWSDTYYATLHPFLTTQFDSYDSCFQIYRYYAGPNMEFNDDYWFRPGIGMVMIHFNEVSLGPKSIRLWQLKRYSLH